MTPDQGRIVRRSFDAGCWHDRACAANDEPFKVATVRSQTGNFYRLHALLYRQLSKAHVPMKQIVPIVLALIPLAAGVGAYVTVP